MEDHAKEFTTEELFDMFFKTRPLKSTSRIRGQIDRPEVYAFEKKIGKQIVEMNTQELIEMMRTFTYASIKDGYKVKIRTYEIMISLYRSFFEWYIDNIKIIKNPFNSCEIRGKVSELFVRNGDVLTWKDLEELIESITVNSPTEVANYDECLIRAGYEGFPQMIDIVKLKEKDINREDETMIVRNRKIQVSTRLIRLFDAIHDMDSFPAHRGNYTMVDCEGSYFKFPTREVNVNDKKDQEFWAAYLNRVFTREIRVKMNNNISFRMVYLLGFYDYVVKQWGKEEVDRVILSKRDSEAAEKLMDIAKEYGIVEKNVTILKMSLSQFVKE